MLKRKKLIIGIVTPVIILVLIYFGFVFYFKSHFFFRSTLNGVNSSGATVDKVMDRIREKSDDYVLTVKGEGVSEEKILPKDVAMEVADSKAAFKEVLDKQNAFLWIGALFKPRKYDSKVVVNFDEGKLDQKIAGLKAVTNQSAIKTEDAHLSLENGKYVVVDEVYGTEVDNEALKKKITSCIMEMKGSLNLKKDGCYVMPKIKADDEKLNASKDALNKKLEISFVYNVGGNKETVSKETMASFMGCDENANITYNDEAISEFVSEMAKKYNTAGRPKTLKTSYGSTVTVPGGSYGWKIDKAAEAEQIKADLDAGKDVNRDFVYSQTANSRGDSDFGGSYIEVNRTAQHMFVYKDGAQIISSDVVTGNITKGRETHVGAYFIAYKERNATLRGDDYESHVAYWMPFHNGEGLHDATWQPSFGGTYYKVRGSHGCVNLPLSVAKSVFENVSAGYPVLVYDLPGTENNSRNTGDAQRFQESLNAMGVVTTLDRKDEVIAMRKAYDKLTPEAQGLVSNISILTQSEANIATLEAGGTL